MWVQPCHRLLRGKVCLGMGLAPLQLLVGFSPVLLLLTPFCLRFPRLGHALVRVEVPWGILSPWRACVPDTAGLSPALSCPSRSQQLGSLTPVCVQWVLAGEPGAVVGGRQMLGVGRAGCKCLCPHCGGERLDLAPVPWGGWGDGQRVMKGVSG